MKLFDSACPANYQQIKSIILNIVFQHITPIGLESTHISGKLPAN